MAVFTFTADPTASTSVQGQLASQYTNWVNAQIKAIADYIGYLVAQKTGDVEAGKAAVAAIESGDFSITDLFNAAQQKGGTAPNDVAGSPEPKLTIDGIDVEIDIKDFMSGEKTETWQTTSKVGKTTETIYHAREFYGTIAAGEYPEDWANPKVNTPPEADPIVRIFAEHLSTYDNDHEITNLDPVYETINLLTDANASDPDGHDLTVANLTFVGFDTPPGYVSLTGGVLSIDVNSREFDDLRIGEPTEIVIQYDILDGKGGVYTNTATITIIGTADQYEGTSTGIMSNTHISPTNAGGKVNGNVLVVDPDNQGAEEGWFDFSNFRSGSITASATGLTEGGETIGISDADGEDWDGAFKLEAAGATKDAELLSGALADGQVDYNVRFTQTQTTDQVTVTVDYQYDYWYWA